MSFCVVCDRLSFCRHEGGPRYDDARFLELAEFGPVTTANGEHARGSALRVLEAKLAGLEESSRNDYHFPDAEGHMARELGRTIATLHGMAPLGELFRTDHPDRLEATL